MNTNLVTLPLILCLVIIILLDIDIPFIFYISLILTISILNSYESLPKLTKLEFITYPIVIILGGLLSLPVQMMAYLSIVTSSHTSKYSEYGIIFSDFYYHQTMLIIIFIGLLLSLAIVFSKFNKQTMYFKYLKLFRYSYFLLFNIFLFLPSSIFVISLSSKHSELLSWSFNFFISSAGVTNIDSVYSLRYDILNPRLSLTSSWILIKYMAVNSFIFMGCIVFDKVFFRVKAKPFSS